jgi:hypothetical protein
MTESNRRPLFQFKVWIEQQKSNIFAAHCLETGAVATADDADTVVEMIEEVLESEAALALDANDFTNLYSSPATPDIWFKWNEAAQKHEPKKRQFEIKSRKKPTPGDMGPQTPNIPKKPVVSSQIEVARSIRQHA